MWGEVNLIGHRGSTELAGERAPQGLTCAGSPSQHQGGSVPEPGALEEEPVPWPPHHCVCDHCGYLE